MCARLVAKSWERAVDNLKGGVGGDGGIVFDGDVVLRSGEDLAVGDEGSAAAEPYYVKGMMEAGLQNADGAWVMQHDGGGGGGGDGDGEDGMEVD